MPSYKVTYFSIQGLAEPIRFLLSYGGVEFEDVRFDEEDWPKFKPSTPFGQVPVLEIDDKKIDQSTAISRYLAKQFGLAGRNDWEALEIDATVATLEDLRAKISAWHYEPVEAVKAPKREPLVKEILPYYLERLDTQVKANGGYFVGGALSWADIWFVALLGYLNYIASIDLTEKYANLKQLKARVLELPRIKSWVEKRPVTEN